MSLRPTERFSDRVQDYVRHRPGYPADCVRALCALCGWGPGDRVADVGAGTGFFARQLLGEGLRVVGVEPNAEMRAAGEVLLGEEERFESIAATAEETGLDEGSVVGITAAQAFHWFDLDRVREEFRRILRPGGRVALIWNARRTTTRFLAAYEEHLRGHGIRYEEINHMGLPESSFERFYGHRDFGPTLFDHAQHLDWEGLQGRHFSSSYVPARDHPGYGPARADLRRIFEQHAASGRVTIEYDTKVFCGPIA